MWRIGKSEEAPATIFETLLKVCHLAIPADGTLEVFLSGPSLKYEALRLVIDRIENAGADAGLKRVVFDFAEIEEIPSPWTAVLALLIRLGHRAPFSCQVRTLRGQPANIVSLYGRSRDLTRLLNEDGSSVAQSVIRRAS